MGATNTTSTPTLNVGGCGAVTIKYLDLSTSPILTAGNTYTFVYSAALNVWMYGNGGLIASSYFVVPLAVQIALCNAVGTDCWIQIPHLFDDADAVSFGSAISSTLNKTLSVYIEYSNEFEYTGTQKPWGIAVGTAKGFPNPNYNSRSDMIAYEFRRLVGGDITPNWPSGGPTLKPVMGFWIAAPSYSDFLTYSMEGYDLTLDANGNYCNGSGCTIVTNWTSAPNRPLDFMKVISTATYFAGPSIPSLEGYYVTTESTKPISSISLSGSTITATGSGFTNGDRINISCNSTCGTTQLNGTWGTVANVSGDTFQLTNITGGCSFYDTVGLNCTDIDEGATISIASPGVVTWSGSNTLANGNAVVFSTTGALPTGLTAGTAYCVEGLSGSHFNIYQSDCATPVTTSGAQSGVHTAWKVYSSNFSGYSAYGSGGTVARQEQNINSALITAASEYAAGDATDVATALNWVANDVATGTRTGNTVLTNLAQLTSVVYPAMNTAFSSTGLPYVMYEGGYEGVALDEAVAIMLGLDTGCVGAVCNGLPASMFYSYTAGQSAVSNLLLGYKYSPYFANTALLWGHGLVQSALGKSAIPGWYLDVSSLGDETLVWALSYNDIYGTQYDSWNGLQSFNHGNWLLKRDLDPASNDNSPVGINEAA